MFELRAEEAFARPADRAVLRGGLPGLATDSCRRAGRPSRVFHGGRE